MKKIMPVLLIVFLSSSLAAQDNAISKYFSDHLENPTFEKFIVSEKSFELFEDVEGETSEERQVLTAIADLEGIIALVNEKSEDATALYRDAATTIAADGNYEELVTLENKNTNVQILLREELDQVREFLLIVGDKEHFVLASLYGDIDLPNILKFSKVLQKNSRDWFELVDDGNTKELVVKENTIGKPTLTIDDQQAQFEEIKVYPNVVLDKVNIQDNANIDATYQLEFFSLMGESIQKMDSVNLPYTLQFNDLPSGAYFIRLTNEAGVYKNFRIVKP